MLNMKRGFILIAAIFFGLLLVNSASAEANKNTTELAQDIYRFERLGYSSMFVVTSDGVVVIEPIDTEHSKELLKAIQSVTNQKIRYLIYSHNHWDHSGGGKVFQDVGATIISHEEAFEWMNANPHQDLTLPDETWSGNRKDILLGGTTIELHYLGMNHGSGMTVFRLPKGKIVYIADLVTPGMVLFTIGGDFHIKELLRSLKEIEAMDFKTAIFTHGRLGSKKDVTGNRQFIEDLRGAIIAEIKKGTNRYKIPYLVKLPKYEKWFMYKEWLHMNAWKVLQEEYMGPFTWRPEYKNIKMKKP